MKKTIQFETRQEKKRESLYEDTVDIAVMEEDDIESELLDGDLNRTGTCWATCTENNTHVTLMWQDGDKQYKLHKSGGNQGYKGAKRGRPHTAETISYQRGKEARQHHVDGVHVVLSGVGRGRNRVRKGLMASKLRVRSVSDATPEPHNGCRSKKVRRV